MNHQVIKVDSLKNERLIKKESIFDFMAKDEIFEMTLEANFDSLLFHKKKSVEYIPGNIYFRNKDLEIVDLKVEIKPRGKYRRKVCQFPPLRLKFKKKGLKKMGLSRKHNSLKLVSHCLDNKKEAKRNILKEYLIYKIYNLHSPYSLRAQLVKINYVQSGSGKKMFERIGILLEDDYELARRTDSKIVEKKYCAQDSIDTYNGTVHALFQCMIGNADWSTRYMRNVKLLRPEPNSLLCTFPYDFDFSGLVSAKYAIPNPDYKLKSTRQRVFLGKMYSDEEMKEVASHFINQKKATLRLVKEFNLLNRRCRKDVIKYLKSFYEILEDEENMATELTKLCPKK
ncbi:MAG: hypothetical protein P8M17_07135 [Saprospiraceae bacterium]|nr:hypothetical protein [Saprospiraceae bacterium]MDG1435659.1 hypothetical protein [Saprospiraceae bacterium]MDG2418749.1 hypothetical protein [Saprospiraceae bacterium]